MHAPDEESPSRQEALPLCLLAGRPRTGADASRSEPSTPNCAPRNKKGPSARA